MKGRVLQFDMQSGMGVVRGDDGHRYQFRDIHWLDRTSSPVVGLEVDFAVENGEARDILSVRSAPAAGGAPQAMSGATGNGMLFGILSIVAAVLGFIPAFGFLFLVLGLIFGIIARKQGKVAENNTAVMLGTIGIVMFALVAVVDLLLFGALMSAVSISGFK